MKLMSAAVAAVASVLTLTAGCSNADNPRSADAAPNSSSSPSTSAHPTATVADFAVVIAKHHADWDDQVAQTEENCLDPALVMACSLGYQTLGMKAETLHIRLTNVYDSAVKGSYKGSPPEEIEDLLTETEVAALDVRDAVDAFLATSCVDPFDPACASEAISMQSAISGLSRSLDAWSAY